MTTASTLFDNQIDEQLVMERTGHRSTTAVRMYKRAGGELQQQVSNLLQPPAPERQCGAPKRARIVSHTIVRPTDVQEDQQPVVLNDPHNVPPRQVTQQAVLINDPVNVPLPQVGQEAVVINAQVDSPMMVTIVHGEKKITISM